MKKSIAVIVALAGILCVMFSVIGASATDANLWNMKNTFNGGFVGQFPSSEVIGAGGTITADVCGGVKRIHTNGTTAVTTDTTNTLTAPTTDVGACCMDIINDGTGAITLDNNALFFSASGSNVALGVGDTIRVCTDGAAWYQIGGTGNN